MVLHVTGLATTGINMNIKNLLLKISTEYLFRSKMAPDLLFAYQMSRVGCYFEQSFDQFTSLIVCMHANS